MEVLQGTLSHCPQNLLPHVRKPINVGCDCKTLAHHPGIVAQKYTTVVRIRLSPYVTHMTCLPHLYMEGKAFTFLGVLLLKVGQDGLETGTKRSMGRVSWTICCLQNLQV